MNSIIFLLFLIFAGAAIFSTAALYTRQSLLVAYMLLGIVLGPFGLKWVATLQFVQKTGDIGIIFLLFLLGLHLHPQNLLHLFKKMTWIAVTSSLVFGLISFVIGRSFGYNMTENLIISIAMMFSSTIIGLKLLPTTVLHHQRLGEIMISVLLLQDLIAIIALLITHGLRVGSFSWQEMVKLAISLPILLLVAFFFVRLILLKLFRKFDRIREYLLLLAIAWCLGLSVLATYLNLSYEIGAFIAGVAIATNPISFYIAENLKPLRDFFLVLFFFAIGASFNLQDLPSIIMPALVLSVALMVIKPSVFYFLLRQIGESKSMSMEIGVRLAQGSEFSLLIAYMALNSKLIAGTTSSLIQAVTIITFIVSSYWVVLRYPTPVAISERLRRD